MIKRIQKGCGRSKDYFRYTQFAMNAMGTELATDTGGRHPYTSLTPDTSGLIP
jgi:hypothetical protein